MDQLTLSVVPEVDDVWRIELRLQTNAFSGVGSAWGWPDQLASFAEQVSTYPLHANDPPKLRFGVENGEGDGLHLAVEVTPLDARGTLSVSVVIADQLDTSCRLRAKFLTSYAALDRFIPELRALADGRRATATLVGA